MCSLNERKMREFSDTYPLCGIMKKAVQNEFTNAKYVFFITRQKMFPIFNKWGNRKITGGEYISSASLKCRRGEFAIGKL